jgi:hypothetical protein
LSNVPPALDMMGVNEKKIDNFDALPNYRQDYRHLFRDFIIFLLNNTLILL